VIIRDVFTRRGMRASRCAAVIIGLDVVGEIAELGAGVEGWKVGDRVLIDPVNRVEGGLMGETRTWACRILPRQGASAGQDSRCHRLRAAAALPVAYGTAIRMMNAIGQIKAGERC